MLWFAHGVHELQETISAATIGLEIRCASALSSPVRLCRYCEVGSWGASLSSHVS